jgi:hypothetical protein
MRFWYDLSSHWEMLQAAAEELKKKTKDYPGSKYRAWRPDREFVGLCGEFGFAKLTGLPFDLERRISGEGDGGFDFPDIGVKTVDHPTPQLWVGLWQKLEAPYWVLMHLQRNLKRVRYLGWMHLNVVETYPVKSPNGSDWPSYVVPHQDLTKGEWPPSLAPPEQPAFSFTPRIPEEKYHER